MKEIERFNHWMKFVIQSKYSNVEPAMESARAIVANHKINSLKTQNHEKSRNRS